MAEETGDGAARTAAFITRRLEPQLAWFEAKAAQAKRWHFGLAGTQIAATALIPVVNLLPHGAVSSTILAAVAGISFGIGALAGHQTHWVRYRATATVLQKLRLHHELGLGDFEGEGAAAALVGQVEAILRGEHEGFSEAVQAGVLGKKVRKKEAQD